MCRQRCPHAASAGRAQMGDLGLALGARGCVIEPARSVELGGITARPRWSTRMVAAAGVVVLVLGLLALKLAQLQVYDSRALAGIARANTVHHIVLEADRGIIYDRHGVPLVQNIPVSPLQVVPGGMPADARARASELALLAALTGRPEEDVYAAVATAEALVPL